MKKIICLVFFICCLTMVCFCNVAYAEKSEGTSKNQGLDRAISFVEIELPNDAKENAGKEEEENDQLYVGKTLFLDTIVEKKTDSAPDKTILVWESSDESIATVNNGTVTGVSKGTVTIRCRAEDNELISAEKYIDVILPVTAIEMPDSKVTVLLFEDRTENGVQLAATVLPEDAFCQELVWTSNNENVAKVDENGYVTAILPGTAVITATSPDEYSAGTKKSTCTVTVLQAASSVVLDTEELILNLGATQALKATVLPDNTSNKTIIWETSNPDVVTVTNGQLKATGCGEAIVTAKAADESGAYAECKITVIQMVTSITINGGAKEITLRRNEELALEASVAPENASNKAVSWSSSDENVVTVDEDGVIHAVDAGRATINCSAEDGSEKSANIDVFVPRDVSGIQFSEESVELYVGDRLTLTAVVEPEDATNKKLEWSSSDETVAKVDQNGNITAVGGGNAEITAHATDGSGAEVKCGIRVIIATQKIILDETKATLLIGADEKLSIKPFSFTIEPADAEYQTVSWFSSDEEIARVNEEGVVTGLSAGTVTITAMTDDPRGIDKVKAVATVTVGDAIKGIKIDGVNSDKIAKGQSVRLVATLTPEKVFNPNLSWESSNDRILTVDAYGNVRAVGTGTAKITCSATDGSNVSQSKEFTVYQPVTSIKIESVGMVGGEGAKYLFENGDGVALIATVLPEDATNKDVKWSVSDSRLATVEIPVEDVSFASVVLGKKPGTVTITATAQDGSGCSARFDLTVEPIVPITLESISRDRNTGNRLGLTVHNNCSKTTIKNFDFDITMYSYTGDKLTTSGSYSLGSDEIIGPNQNRTIIRNFSGFSFAHEVIITITGVLLSDGGYYSIPQAYQEIASFSF